MTPRKEKLFNKSHASQLFNIAKDDFASAQLLFKAGTGRPENTAFFCQQAIEKSLKAVLIHLEIPVPLVHDAGILVAKLPKDLTPPGGYDLSQLTDFATIRRYEEGSSKLTTAELKAIVKISQEVLDWSESQLRG